MAVGLIRAWLLVRILGIIAFTDDGVLALVVSDLAPDYVLWCTWVHVQNGAHCVCIIAACAWIGCPGLTDLGWHNILDVTVEGSLRGTGPSILNWRIVGRGKDLIVNEMLRLEESFQLLLEELALLQESLDAARARLPTLKDARVLLAQVSVALLELVVLVGDVGASLLRDGLRLGKGLHFVGRCVFRGRGGLALRAILGL